MKNALFSLNVLCLAAACLLASENHVGADAKMQAGGSQYHLANEYKLGGAGGWDYLAIDSSKHRLFISRGNRIMVVDTQTGILLTEIPGIQRSHGIALAPEFNKGFATDGAGSVLIFDYTTLKQIDSVKTDKGSDGVIYDPSSKRIFAMNGDPNTASVIDAASGKLIGTVPLGGGPEFTAADGKGYVFVNLEDKNALAKINARTLKVEQTWPLAPCESPSGLAIDAANERLIVGCHNKLMVFVDGNSGKVIGTVPIGQGVDANRFDPGTGFAFASCGDGTITVAHEDSADKFSAVDVIATQRGARTMEVDPATHNVYTVTAEFGPAPAATADNPRPRPSIVPDSFALLVFTR